MPLIVVHGLGEREFRQRKPNRIILIETVIIEAVIGIKELKLTPEDISFSFVHDPSITSTDIGVIIIVELLFEKPERTSKVHQRLAKAIADKFKALDKILKNNRFVEVAVKRFNPKKDGFSRIDP